MFTCGRWSLTRPGVLYIGRQDGCVDIWDLTDSSLKPSATVTVSSTRVTSMEFCPDLGSNNSQLRSSMMSTSGIGLSGGANKRAELLACGDAGGNLHVLEMPRNLSRAVPHERTLMEAFINREVKRVDYEHERGTGTLLNDDDQNNEPDIPPAPPAPSSSSSSNGEGNGEDDAAMLALAAEEAEYKALEDKFIAELGLSEDELPTHWKNARAEALPAPPDDKSQ
jgi:hypothetical protein